MGVCMSLFYDTSECRWPESTLAQAVLLASQDEHRHPAPTSFNQLRPADFSEVRACSQQLRLAGGGKVHVWEYAPRAFRFFREGAVFKNSVTPDMWERSWRDTSETSADKKGMGAGKSGATFLKSNDRQWLIKTIDVKEVMKQLEMLSDYLQHFQAHPNSLLMRHIQMLKLQERDAGGNPKITKYVLVAENVVASADLRDPNDKGDVMVVNSWDLKGRQPKPGKLPQAGQLSGQLGKDKELTRHFALPPEVRQELIGFDSPDGTGAPGILRRDADFLMRHNLMDYSLLVNTWPSCREEHGSALPPRMTQEQKWLLLSAYDHDGDGLCPDAAEGLYLPRNQLAALELYEANIRMPKHADPHAGAKAVRWQGSWDAETADAQRALLMTDPERPSALRLSAPGRPVHKYHNGVVSASGDEIYLVGIIDILTEYHRLKRLANCCKKFAFFESQLSTIPPDKYERRFSRYMRDVFPAGPVSSVYGVSPATTAAKRRQDWRSRGAEAGPRGQDQWRLTSSRGGEQRWIDAATAAGGADHGEDQWDRMSKRNCLRLQYAEMRQKVKENLFLAQQRAAGARDPVDMLEVPGPAVFPRPA
eukprot:Hpha_TRINITY_DN15218_c1_g2::TRINITY_DN15218_c1_g2_i3::g.65740::m.65740/K00889/PIP5K; 1-phosphatidylinositol-4-phosphate 5-kinase